MVLHYEVIQEGDIEVADNFTDKEIEDVLRYYCDLPMKNYQIFNKLIFRCEKPVNKTVLVQWEKIK